MFLGAQIAQSVARLASDYLCPSAVQVQMPLATTVKLNYKIVPASVHACIKWFECHLPGAMVSQSTSRTNVENCPGFPPPLDSRRLRSIVAYLNRNAKLDVYVCFT